MTDTSNAPTLRDAAAPHKNRKHKPAVKALFYTRSMAAALAGYTTRTLDRRERLDADIPQRVSLGPNGGAPYAYRCDEWDQYLANRPRMPRPVGGMQAERSSATPPGNVKANGARIPKATPGKTPKPAAKAPKPRQAATPTTAPGKRRGRPPKAQPAAAAKPAPKPAPKATGKRKPAVVELPAEAAAIPA